MERWLIECESSMRETLKDTLKRSFEAAARDARLQWVGQWPGQVVLAVDCMYWTQNTAKAIVKGSLEPYTQQLTDELLQVRVGSAEDLYCSMLCAECVCCHCGLSCSRLGYGGPVADASLTCC